MLKLTTSGLATLSFMALSLGMPLAPASAQIIELAVDSSPAGLDPHLATAFTTFQVINGTVYEGLTAIDKDLRTVPGLASAWAVAPDGKTVTFTLRSGVKFHDGSAFEAADAVASLKRVLAKEIASPLASRLAAIDTVEAKDATTLVLNLKEPSAPLLTSLAGIAMVPRVFETNKDALQKQPVGTGPFKFATWQPNGFIELAKFDGYWAKGAPRAAGLKFNIVPESATRQAGLASGQYAILPNIDAATALQLKGRAGVKLADTLELAYTLIGFNTSKPPFDNPKVRAAVNLAINRDEIIQAALFGAGKPAGPLSPALKDWALDVKDYPCYAASPEKAIAALKEAGVTMPATLTMLVLPRQDIKDIAAVLQQQLAKVGIKVELKTPELGAFIQDWKNSNFDLFASTNSGSPEPDDYFYRAIHTGGSTNVFKYSNPEVDKALDVGRSALTMADRKAAYDKVQRLIACEGPIAHLTYGQLFTATKDGVTGFDIMANRSLQSLAQTSLAK